MFKLRRQWAFLALFLAAVLCRGAVAAAQSPAPGEVVVGAAVGTYMDRQQERLAHIPGAAVRRMREDTLLVRLDADTLFDADSAALVPRGRDTLDQVADVINDYWKTAVVVQGHGDGTGSAESCQALSERRAHAVEKHLVNRGVDPERVNAIGFGAAAPVAGNDTESGRQKNRRVDLLLKARTGPLRQSR